MTVIPASPRSAAGGAGMAGCSGGGEERSSRGSALWVVAVVGRRGAVLVVSDDDFFAVDDEGPRLGAARSAPPGEVESGRWRMNEDASTISEAMRSWSKTPDADSVRHSATFAERVRRDKWLENNSRIRPDGKEIDEKRNGAQVVIRYADARRGQVVLDVNASEVEDLASRGTSPGTPRPPPKRAAPTVSYRLGVGPAHHGPTGRGCLLVDRVVRGHDAVDLLGPFGRDPAFADVVEDS